MRIALTTSLVFLTLFFVPVIVYGIFSRATGLQPPGEDPSAFLAGVAVSKIGTAIAFVGIWLLGRETLEMQWGLYVLCWWVMFVLGEVGQAMGPDYSWQEAIAGMISETLYLPVSGLLVARLLPA
jgi:hypothetical protein